jgi:hypothetical protein
MTDEDKAKQSPQLIEELDEIMNICDGARENLHFIHDWLYEEVVGKDCIVSQLPPEIGLPLNRLQEQLESIRSLANKGTERLGFKPCAKLIAGECLTEQEYFLLRAMGINELTAKSIGLSSVDDYKVFLNLYYEDEKWRCYINPALKPRDPEATRIAMRFGRPPEELHLKNLRPEQKEFFKKYLPEVLTRFQRD